MAYVSLFRRPALAAVLSLSIAGCSTDDLSPSARIDSSSRVSAIPQVRGEGRAQREIAYPSQDMPVAAASENSGDALPVNTHMQATSQRLPMIDSEPDNGGQQALAATGTQPMTVPPEGVNMDAMLGVAPASDPVVGLAEEQNREIAEGNVSQPVVGGIGEDTVQQLGGPQRVASTVDADPGYDPDLPPLSPEKIAAEEARKAQFLDQQQRVMLQKRQVQEEQQVAFLPRAENPVSEPDFTGRMPADEVACRQRLKKLKVQFTDIPRISNGKACGIDYPIELSGLSGGIEVKPAVKLNCEVTEAFAQWVKNELAPSARYRYLSGIKRIKPLGGYSCRTMNSKRGNPMSEHAHGNAIDVGKFVLNSGKEIDVRKPGFFAFREKGLLKAVRSDSCKYFNTVLGPGSDPQHKDHFHFDLRNRKSGYRHCD
ncbi:MULTISPECIES: extensin family protein [unclassified Rhizobium]|uniref:extensin-like domain-containing protein n=1 Tax=unclassified Rhizobium TaxID=2613769 RepID=UPI000714D79B|nr:MULTISPECIES: extensin family protein [unclassified Rhizobium]KQS98092.1 extensin [Rhizobium sp. Leaf386]KQT00354.1 extensin [Rhizobium sp. Leaf391]KQT97357.1 extensin [Rhizobium sp. Leaf453]